MFYSYFFVLQDKLVSVFTNRRDQCEQCPVSALPTGGRSPKLPVTEGRICSPTSAEAERQ